MKKEKKKLSLISFIHYIKLFYRSLLFLLAAAAYAVGKLYNKSGAFNGFDVSKLLLGLIWIIYAAEMLARFFPSRLESAGCQKQFKQNYMPAASATNGNRNDAKPQSWKTTFAVTAAWTALNAFIGALYCTGIIDAGALVLVSLAYGVCDMICILFFCPFQTWFMKNRCCASCRIYNWDFAMMFTPFIFIPGKYTWSLLALSLLLLLRWEITFRRYPERFSPETNDFLSCANCKEKLCRHKKQLHTFWKNNF